MADQVPGIRPHRVSMRGQAELVFEFGGYGSQVYRALTPELEDDLHRGTVHLDLDGGHLRLLIRAQDVVSLRASLNTWIRLIKIGWEMENI